MTLDWVSYHGGGGGNVIKDIIRSTNKTTMCTTD